MPLYDYECPVCGKEYEEFRKVENRLEVNHCGAVSKLNISITSRPVILDYYSENLDAVITGPEQKKQVMKAKGVENAC